MKTPTISRRGTILATSGILLVGGLASLRVATAQDRPAGVPTPPAAQPVQLPTPTAPNDPPLEVLPAPGSSAIPGEPRAVPTVELTSPAPPVPAGEVIRIGPQTISVESKGLPGGRGFAWSGGGGSEEGGGAGGAMTTDPSLPQPARLGRARSLRAAGIADAKASGRGIVFADTVLNEEVLASPQDAARHYEDVVADFDSRRAHAAQAVFRLAESYRKLGRVEEARIQYARILREFVDFADLANLSQQQLAQVLPRQQPTLARIENEGTSFAGLPQEYARRQDAAAQTALEERALLIEEIQLLEQQLLDTRQQINQGVLPTTAAVAVQREILQLKRQLLQRPPLPDLAPTTGSGAPSPQAGFSPLTAPTPETPPSVAPLTVDPAVLQTK